MVGIGVWEHGQGDGYIHKSADAQRLLGGSCVADNSVGGGAAVRVVIAWAWDNNVGDAAEPCVGYLHVEDLAGYVCDQWICRGDVDPVCADADQLIDGLRWEQRCIEGIERWDDGRWDELGRVFCLDGC